MNLIKILPILLMPIYSYASVEYRCDSEDLSYSIQFSMNENKPSQFKVSSLKLNNVYFQSLDGPEIFCSRAQNTDALQNTYICSSFKAEIAESSPKNILELKIEGSLNDESSMVFMRNIQPNKFRRAVANSDQESIPIFCFSQK